MLIGAGISLDQILDMTMPQIGLVTEMVVGHKLEMVEMLISPLVGMMGGKSKKGSTSTQNRKTSTKGQARVKSSKREQKEAHRTMKMAKFGLKVKT